ncbi:MAG: NAD(P)/FAD-dependent oxidoreductase [Promethearchaeota archaeon]
MEEYDVFIAGGGFAGSVAAKFAAKEGLKTLFIERYKTPRMKSCSGIQFGYLPKILGEEIPRDKLCSNEITKVSIILPNGKAFKTPFKMYNFMRDTFDDWLNNIAIENGAKFNDECSLIDWESNDKNIIVTVEDKEKNHIKYKTKYLIDATGLMPKVRLKERPQDFENRSSGATINYYFDGKSNLDPQCLYQYWNLDYNNMMFAWIYKKNNLWVIGTGYDKGISKIGQNFFNFVKQKYNLKGQIVKKEGFSSNINMGNRRVHLGGGRIFYVGDAAGLVDPYRGVGMDVAALSGRLAAKAIVKAERKNKDAFKLYSKYMNKYVKQTNKNTGKGIYNLTNNDELLAYMKKNMLKNGIKMVFHNFLNKFRPAKKIKLLPP